MQQKIEQRLLHHQNCFRMLKLVNRCKCKLQLDGRYTIMTGKRAFIVQIRTG